jgi:Ca-activated chloride channel homolog
MRFAEPMFLWGLFTLPLWALLLVYAWRRRRKMAERFASAPMLARLAPPMAPWRGWVKGSLLLLALLFLFLALARPQWGRKLEVVERKGLDIVLVQDISLSMLATDIQPSRLVRSRHEMSAFLDALQGDRVALVAFSGEARTLVPLTLDYASLRLFLDELRPGWLMPGTDIGAAMRQAMKVFAGAGGAPEQQVMVLLTDGEEHNAEALQVAQEAADIGIRIYTIGIGSRSGVPIPVPAPDDSMSYKKDKQGNIVTTHLEEETLKSIAANTGGRYYYAGPGEFQLQKVLSDIASLEKKKLASQNMDLYQERYALPLGLALFLLLAESLVSDRGRRAKPTAGRFA